ncbi:MAG: RNA polymerase sigma factor [bacterium]|nr:RNA polymerase sigma factor [bacterium]
MSLSQKEEKSLILKIKNGDQGALSLLWDNLTPKLFGYLINTTRNKTLAEDLLQNTWLKAINALPGFEPRNISIAAWLFAIAKNECRMHWRKSGRETLFDPAKDEETPIKHDEVNNVGNLENKILIEQILGLLSEDDREILRLRYIADLPLNKIANVLKINFVAVRVRMHRALGRARGIIDKNHYEQI